jgi:hypothetical protein
VFEELNYVLILALFKSRINTCLLAWDLLASRISIQLVELNFLRKRIFLEEEVRVIRGLKMQAYSDVGWIEIMLSPWQSQRARTLVMNDRWEFWQVLGEKPVNTSEIRK